ncbi:hypothetical protein TKK_0005924 [Trichogramma kaykai]
MAVVVVLVKFPKEYYDTTESIGFTFSDNGECEFIQLLWIKDQEIGSQVDFDMVTRDYHETKNNKKNLSLQEPESSYYTELKLRNPINQQTITYGHFGRDCFTWEQPKTLKLD